mgnify:FL=1
MSWLVFLVICVGISLGLGILLLGFLTKTPLTTIELASQAFNHIFLGLGGLLATAGGLTIVSEYIERQRAKKIIGNWREKYSSLEVKRGIRLARSDNGSNPVYIIDERIPDHTRHHIMSMATFDALGFDQHDIEVLKNELLVNYKRGNPININVNPD